MTEPPYRASSSFKIPYLRDGLRSTLLLMDDDLLRLIGQVTAHWGQFEFRLNAVIETMLEAAEILDDGWKTLSFPKRLTRLRRANRVLNAKRAGAAKDFEKVADDALELHWQRNVVVHGAYAESHHPWNASPDKLKDPPRSSPE